DFLLYLNFVFVADLNPTHHPHSIPQPSVRVSQINQRFPLPRYFSDDYQRRKENHFRSLSISILELELAFGVRSFSVSSFKTYPRSPICSISFLLRFIKTSKHFSFSVIPQIRLSPLHYQMWRQMM
ncbi:hypothetical protein LINGRAHAP2_LOCUS9808, partial [Linum grandiflorum]